MTSVTAVTQVIVKNTRKEKSEMGIQQKTARRIPIPHSAQSIPIFDNIIVNVFYTSKFASGSIFILVFFYDGKLSKKPKCKQVANTLKLEL